MAFDSSLLSLIGHPISSSFQGKLVQWSEPLKTLPRFWIWPIFFVVHLRLMHLNECPRPLLFFNNVLCPFPNSNLATQLLSEPFFKPYDSHIPPNLSSFFFFQIPPPIWNDNTFAHQSLKLEHLNPQMEIRWPIVAISYLCLTVSETSFRTGLSYSMRHSQFLQTPRWSFGTFSQNRVAKVNHSRQKSPVNLLECHLDDNQRKASNADGVKFGCYGLDVVPFLIVIVGRDRVGSLSGTYGNPWRESERERDHSPSLGSPWRSINFNPDLGDGSQGVGETTQSPSYYVRWRCSESRYTIYILPDQPLIECVWMYFSS